MHESWQAYQQRARTSPTSAGLAQRLAGVLAMNLSRSMPVPCVIYHGELGSLSPGSGRGGSRLHAHDEAGRHLDQAVPGLCLNGALRTPRHVSVWQCDLM
jgi:hypothetical protein